MNRLFNALCGCLLPLSVSSIALPARAVTPDDGAISSAAVIEQIWLAKVTQLQLQLLPEVLEQLGLSLVGLTDRKRIDLPVSGVLRFMAPTGKLDALVETSANLDAPLLWQVNGDDVEATGLRVLPVPPSHGVGVAFDVMDGSGAVWMQLRNAHPLISPAGSTLELRNMGVLVGPALATQLGDVRFTGTGLGMARMYGEVQHKPSAAPLPSSCAVPQWPSPGQPGDVALTSLNGIQVMRGLSMDGPGGTDGEVVVAPSATLTNVGTRDMPWYNKFSGSFPPYANDQHPFLVWSLYRMDADGMLVQHARSAVKHAFFTINAGCSCSNGNILGLNCSDTYDAFTNDVPFNEACPGHASCVLAPRSEIVPKLGIWGRCGSIYDQNCDGNPADTQAYGPYDHRLVAREADFDPAAQPGSVQWMEGWYVVRDDGNIDNSMGSTTVAPFWVSSGAGGGTWNFQTNAGPFNNGPVIERWVAANPVPFASRSTRVATSEGEVHLAVRVTALPAARFRYQYALINLDFSRAVVTGTTPNQTVVRALGLNQLTLAGLPVAVDNPRFVDGDRTSLNNWVFGSSATQVQWTAPVNVHLAWGSLLSFSFETNTAPRNGSATLGIAEPGSPSSLSVSTLVPGGELFADGFEN